MPTRVLNSFKIHSGDKILDYRLGEDLDIKDIKSFFQKKYQVKNLWIGPRHVLGILEKNGKEYFLKLATSEGISIVTKNEFNWNIYFNNNYSSSDYFVPKNFACGLYNKKYFYLISEYFAGQLLCTLRSPNQDMSLLIEYLPQIIELTEIIQKLPNINFAVSEYQESDFRNRFLTKVRTWFEDIPTEVCKKYQIKELLNLVQNNINQLICKPRHGDFAPWHMIKLGDKKLGLIDGEHALPDSVENYDICYFIQRVFSVLEKPDIAGKVYLKLQKRGYETSKLQIVLAARAIGGFLDESLSSKPNYQFANQFKNWVLNLS